MKIANILSLMVLDPLIGKIDRDSGEIKKGEPFKNLELSLSVESEGGISNFLEGDLELLMMLFSAMR